MKSRLFNIRLSFEITENKSEGFFLLKNDLISLLDAIQRTGSIKAAAEELGYSFRHIWNELNKWEEELGQSLVNRSRGKNAELSPLAEQLLWTNKEVQAKYKEQIIELQSGISYSFRKAFNSAWDPIVIEGCADSALNLLRRTTDCEIELNFTISRKHCAKENVNWQALIFLSHQQTTAKLSGPSDIFSRRTTGLFSLPPDFKDLPLHRVIRRKSIQY